MFRHHVILCGALCIVLPAAMARSAEDISKKPPKAIQWMDLLNNQKRLKPGDVVGIQIVESNHKALNQLIAVTGEIQAPYVGLVKVEGMTCQELAYKLKGELEKGAFKVATVFVKRDPWDEPLKETTTCSDGKPCVVIFGSVGKQGAYDLNSIPNQKISGLLKLADAHLSKFRAPKIYIVRRTPQGNKRILVNARAILFQKLSEYDLFLRPDDVVIVE